MFDVRHNVLDEFTLAQDATLRSVEVGTTAQAATPTTKSKQNILPSMAIDWLSTQHRQPALSHPSPPFTSSTISWWPFSSSSSWATLKRSRPSAGYCRTHKSYFQKINTNELASLMQYLNCKVVRPHFGKSPSGFITVNIIAFEI